MLQAFFASLEKNNLFDTWEENYLALIKYKSELQDMFGKMDLKEFDTRYKELKPIISNFKKDKADRKKQLAKEKAEEEEEEEEKKIIPMNILFQMELITAVIADWTRIGVIGTA
jgi:hypothetical protein